MGAGPAAVVTAEGTLCCTALSVQPVHIVPGDALVLWLCRASWKHRGKEAGTGIQCDSIACKATCPAVLRQKERRKIAFATDERMMDDGSGRGMKVE